MGFSLRNLVRDVGHAGAAAYHGATGQGFHYKVPPAQLPFAPPKAPPAQVPPKGGGSKLAGVKAQFNVFDNNATYNTVRQGIYTAPAPKVTTQLVNFGKAMVQPAVNIGAQLGNEVGALASNVGDIGRVGVANLTNNPVARRNALLDTRGDRLVTPGQGLGHQGGILGGRENAPGAVFADPQNIKTTVGKGVVAGSYVAGSPVFNAAKMAVAPVATAAVGAVAPKVTTPLN